MEGAGTHDTGAANTAGRRTTRPARAGSPTDALLPDLSRLRLETLLHELIDRAGDVLRNEARLHRLLDAVVSIGRSLAYNDVVDSTVRSARDLVTAEQGGLVVLGPDRTVREVHATGAADALERLLLSGPAEDRPLDRLLSDIRPWRLPDTGFLGVPLRVRGELFGLLCLVERSGHPFTQADEDVAVALAAAAGIAIENARLYEQTARRERWLVASTEIMAHLLGEATLPTTLDAIAERARTVANCDLALLALLDPAREHLVIEVTAGATPERLLGLATPIRGTSLADVVHSGEPRLYARDPAAAAWLPGLDTNADLDIELDLELDLAHGSALLVPLTVGTDTMGVLAMLRTETAAPFEPLDLRLATTFAGHAALALETARAQADRAELAVFQDRDRIARDLHDRVIQRLFGVSLGLQGLTEGLVRPPVAERVSSYVRDLDATIAEIRRTIFSLPAERGARSGPRMLVLDAIELAAEPLGLEPRVELIGPLDTEVPGDLLSDLLATVREGLAAMAQRGSTEVHLSIHADVDNGTLLVRVGDDGADPETGDAPESGGRFGVEPDPAGGISLVWRAPLGR